MKASELKPGDVMDGWMVTDARPVEWETTEGDMDEFILLELERGIPDPGTRRTWYRADEEVEVMR